MAFSNTMHLSIAPGTCHGLCRGLSLSRINGLSHDLRPSLITSPSLILDLSLIHRRRPNLSLPSMGTSPGHGLTLSHGMRSSVTHSLSVTHCLTLGLGLSLTHGLSHGRPERARALARA